MKSQKSSGQLKKPKLFLIRRIVGESMLPALRPGQHIVAIRSSKLAAENIIVLSHGGLEKIKRIKQIDPQRGLYVLGDNPSASTDSRAFGWIMPEEVLGKVIWPHA